MTIKEAKHFIKNRIDVLQKDLAMLIEGSIASDALEVEILDLKEQLEVIKNIEDAINRRDALDAEVKQLKKQAKILDLI